MGPSNTQGRGGPGRGRSGSWNTPNTPHIGRALTSSNPQVAAQETERLSHFLRSHSSEWQSEDVSRGGADSKRGESKVAFRKDAKPVTGLSGTPGDQSLGSGFHSSSASSQQGTLGKLLLSESVFSAVKWESAFLPPPPHLQEARL